MIKAANDNVIVLIPKIEEKTESGLFKGDSVTKEEVKKNTKLTLKVVSVGPACKGVEVGDNILVERTVQELPLECVVPGMVYGKVKAYDVVCIVGESNEG
jgi:co-chaperonin GroES (HSP10)